MKLYLFCLILSLFCSRLYAVDCDSIEASKINPFAKGEAKCVLSAKSSQLVESESKVVLQNLDKLIEKFDVWDNERSLDIQGLNELKLEGTAEEKKRSIQQLIVVSAAYGMNNLNDISSWAASKGVIHPQEKILRRLIQTNAPEKYEHDKLNTKYLDEVLKQLPENMRDFFARGVMDYKVSGNTLALDLNLLKKHSNSYSDKYLTEIIRKQILARQPSEFNQKFLSNVSELLSKANLNSDLESSCSNLAGLSKLLDANDRQYTNEAQKVRKQIIQLLAPSAVALKKGKHVCPDENAVEFIKKLDSVVRKIAVLGIEVNSVSTKEINSNKFSQPQLNVNTNYKQCRFDEIQDALKLNLNNEQGYFIRTTSVGCTLSIVSQLKKTILNVEIRIENENRQNILFVKQNFLNSESMISFLKTGVYLPLPTGIFIK